MGDLIDLKKYRGRNGKLCENSFQLKPEQLLEQIARAAMKIGALPNLILKFNIFQE